MANLQKKIDQAAHALPSQGTITAFIHHNTLHALEHLPFDEAVAEGFQAYGCQPYLSEAEYHEHLASGRILQDDLDAVLQADLKSSAADLVGDLCSRGALQMTMLQHLLQGGPEAELRWLVADAGALIRFLPEIPEAVRRRMVNRTRLWTMRHLRNGTDTDGPSAGGRDAAWLPVQDLVQRFGERSIEKWSDATWQSFTLQALWRACRHGVHQVPQTASPVPRSLRPRDWILEATGSDLDLLVDDLLIRYSAAFLDQGLAQSPLPHRELGFYACFLRMYGQSRIAPEAWMRRLSRELNRLIVAGVTPLESIRESLTLLRIPEAEEEAFLTTTLLVLRGWAGILWQLETRGDRVVRPAPDGSLLEYLAIRLIVERVVAQQMAEELLDHRGPLVDLKSSVRPQRQGNRLDLRAFLVFQIAQRQGWLPADLLALSSDQWYELVHEIEQFNSLQRRRLLQQAYERRYHTQALDALALHVPRRQPAPKTPRFQLMCCIDDREESFRRHLEEVAPDCQTFGAAGFYGVVMYYRGATEAHFAPLCPGMMRPKHWVQEDVADPHQEEHAWRTRNRRALGTAWLHLHRGTRSFLGGAVVAILGSLASVPLIARVILPRFTSRLSKRLGRFVGPPLITQLRLERDETHSPSESSQLGFTLAEMTDIAEGILRDIGLTKNFARLFIALGHGSSSLNNPHASAYNCGACGGGRGGPNARALALIANDPRVRENLRARGIDIPDSTFFIGGYHNTCDDSVQLFDLHRLPASHRDDFEQVQRDLLVARQRNAHERCRRFDSAPLTISEEAALRHVEARAVDLAQSRPEYNHATNALCIVGRREISRGLFLDRRTFLTCYDPLQDDEHYSILLRLLNSAVPVCAGISLEYYFSCIDPEGWGCGSKLPHNVTAMIGVMEGAASDLRPGLSTQMIEIHEPMRLLFIIETTPEAIKKVMEASPTINRLVRNEWIRLAIIDPHTSEIQVLTDGHFTPYSPLSDELPITDKSIDWYHGWRDHLGFATLKASAVSQQNGGQQV